MTRLFGRGDAFDRVEHMFHVALDLVFAFEHVADLSVSEKERELVAEANHRAEGVCEAP